MLMDALARLLIKKEFEDISMQEIADEATLNRATFYLHYPDKNALLQAMTDVPLPRPDRAPRHHLYRLQWSTARHCTRRLRLSC